MRTAGLVLMMAALTSSACASCGGGVRDWGLHRQWRVERDRAHPARPARLVEVPWDDEGWPCRVQASSGRVPAVVRPGERVRLVERDAHAEMELRGIALEAGGPGDLIRVRAGLSGAVLRGRVRGPGLLDLERQSGR